MIWPFALKKKTEKASVLQFDMEAIRELDSLTPEEIVSLVCCCVGVPPEKAIIRNPELWPSLVRLTKEVAE